MTLNESFDSLTVTVLQCKSERDELLAACKLLMSRIEDGTLVRNISNDGSSDLATGMMEFARDLQQVQTAIYKAEHVNAHQAAEVEP